jgi:hypothetical protein
MVKESRMKIRNNRLWRSESARNEIENSIRIVSEELDPDSAPNPILKITKVEITFHRQRQSINLRNLLLLRFNNQKIRD